MEGGMAAPARLAAHARWAPVNTPLPSPSLALPHLWQVGPTGLEAAGRVARPAGWRPGPPAPSCRQPGDGRATLPRSNRVQGALLAGRPNGVTAGVTARLYLPKSRGTLQIMQARNAMASCNWGRRLRTRAHPACAAAARPIPRPCPHPHLPVSRPRGMPLQGDVLLRHCTNTFPS